MLAVKAGDYKVAALFDMARSGAQITFDYFFFSRPRDRIVDIVADRDLWQFKLPETEAFYSVICSYELNFENFGRFAVDLQDGDTAAALAVEGEAILRQQKRNIQTLIRQTGRKMVIGGIEVPVINAPYYMVSEACTALSEANPEAPFVASYYDAPDQRTFSLRVRTGDADVSKVAALYGGGGHPKASGFSRPHGWEGDQ